MAEKAYDPQCMEPKPQRIMRVNSERRPIVKTPIEMVEWQFEALYRMPDPKLPAQRYSEGQGNPGDPGGPEEPQTPGCAP